MTGMESVRPGGSRVATLVAASGAGWESGAVATLADPGSGVVLLKRCLDLADLLAAASTGAAQVAVVAAHLAGLDADSVDRLGSSGVRVVVVGAGPAEADRLARIGVAEVLDEPEPARLAAAIRSAAAGEARVVAREAPTAEVGPAIPVGGPGSPGRLVAVWGPTGGPGRTTVALGLAAEAARRGHRTLLLDSDPYGGAVAQHLAVLEEVSGLLAAVRQANTGQLTPARLAGVARQVGPGLRVLTGLPRPDRWAEVRRPAFEELLTQARHTDPLVVVDAGSGLDPGSSDPFANTVGRDDTTVAAVTEADDVVLVASADPVGLARLARSVVDLQQLRPGGPAYVVVNRWRAGLGWSAEDVTDMVRRLSPTSRVHFLPDDRAAADRALVTGRTLAESGESGLRRAVTAWVDVVLADIGHDLPAPEAGSAPGRRRPLLRRVRRRQTVSSR